ncbi:MAG: alkaline phosphatase family protein [Gemmatimonadales bacterium]
MPTPGRCSSAVLLIIDGLRPDAIRPDTMPSLSALRDSHWSTSRAETVAPSVTVAALTSLATGVGPGTHGLIAPGLRSLQRLRRLTPLLTHLRRHRVPTRIAVGAVPIPRLILARALIAAAGGAEIQCAGDDPASVGALALGAARRADAGLTVAYVNDCDVAGHAHGWMSRPYLDAAARCDRAVRHLATLVDGDNALLCVTADHGGGGIHPTDHDLPHPINATIPIILAGAGIRGSVRSDQPATILDIPPTLLSALGVPVPASYEGRVLSEAFEAAAAAA